MTGKNKLDHHVTEDEKAGLQIMASQWTMSSQNWVLNGRILGLQYMLSNYLLVQRNFNSLLLDKKEGQHLCFRNKNKMILDKLTVKKFPVVTNFHDVFSNSLIIHVMMTQSACIN